MARGDKKNSKNGRRNRPAQPRDPQTGRFMKDPNKGKANTNQKELNIAQEIVKAYEIIARRQKETTKEVEKRNKLEKENSDLLKDRASDLREAKDIQKDIDNLLYNSLNLKGEEADIAADMLSNLQEEKELVDKINSARGVSNSLLASGAKFLGFGDDFQKNIVDGVNSELLALEEKGSLMDGIGGKLQGMNAIAGSVGKAITGKIFDPVVLIGLALDYNKQLTDLQKNLGLSYGESQKLKFELDMVANTMGDMAIHTADVAKAFASINDRIGAAATNLAKFGDAVEQAAVLEKKMGLSAEASAEFAAASIRSGKLVKDIKEDAIGVAVAAEKEHGTRLNLKQLMEEVGQVSGQVRAQLAANPELIMEAVAQAKALGMALEEVAAAADSLLNFEDSISNELEAELLLGRQLNLERARAAALAGDYATVAKEISEQVGDFNEFSQLNVLQQRALADAVGMTADQLSDQLLAKEDLGKLAQEAREAGNEELAEMLEKRSAQEKFNDAVMKLKDVFVSIAGPLSVILELLAAILKPIGVALSGMSKIFSILSGGREELSGWEKVLGSIAVIATSIYLTQKAAAAVQKIQTMLSAGEAASDVTSAAAETVEAGAEAAQVGPNTANTALDAAQAAADLTSASATTLGIGIAPILIGLGIGMAALIAAAVMAGGAATAVGDIAMGPEGGGGYGKRTLIAPEGAFALNNNDSIIAGTKLFRSDDTISMGAGKVNMGGIDYNKLASTMSKVQVRPQMRYDSFAAKNKNNKQHYSNITGESRLA